HGYKFSRKNPTAVSSMQMRKADGGTRGETVRGFGPGGFGRGSECSPCPAMEWRSRAVAGGCGDKRGQRNHLVRRVTPGTGRAAGRRGADGVPGAAAGPAARLGAGGARVHAMRSRD